MSRDPVTPKRPWRRRQYLLDSTFQFNFLSYSIVNSVIAIVLFFGANRYLVLHLQRKLEEAGLPQHHMAYDVIHYQMRTVDLAFFTAALFSIILLILVGVVFSNRVAGPMKRLKDHMDRIKSGEEITSLNFRQGDYFDEVAQSYNELVEYLTHKKK